MSHEEEAPSLARWLDQPPGTAPPDDLDREVVEAVYALRPDLAPRPRLTADDILASVTRGPLAGTAAEPTPVPSEAGGEIVPFPARKPAAPEAEVDTAPPAPKRTVWAGWARGTGGIGLALVAAATLLLVAVPTLQQQGPAEPVGAPAAAPVELPASPAASMRSVEVEPQAQEPPPPPPPPAARTAPAREVAASPAQSAPAAEGAYDMKPMAPIRGRDTIPEVAAELRQQAESDAVADAELPPPAAAPSPVAAEEEPAADLDAVRDRALPRDVAPGGWREGVDGDALARFDRAIEQANAARARGDLRAAADTLAAAVAPPPRAGMHVAALAAQDYLRAGLPALAASVAQRGLGLSSANTPERSLLLVLYGDALEAQGQPAPAHDAYDQADQGNGSR